MALSISCEGSFSADGLQMFFSDDTGNYNVTSNPTGWGSPNPASTTVTTFQVICNWISAGAIITYNFTVSSGTITVATVTDNEGTVYNCLADLASTAFPIVDPNFLDLTDTFDDEIVLPELADGQFKLTYKVIGYYATGTPPAETAFTYTTSTTFFRISDLCCCIKNLRLEIEPDCACSDSKIKQVNQAEFWLNSALAAVDTGKSNETALNYFTKAQDICENGCGCV